MDNNINNAKSNLLAKLVILLFLLVFCSLGSLFLFLEVRQNSASALELPPAPIEQIGDNYYLVGNNLYDASITQASGIILLQQWLELEVKKGDMLRISYDLKLFTEDNIEITSDISGGEGNTRANLRCGIYGTSSISWNMGSYVPFFVDRSIYSTDYLYSFLQPINEYPASLGTNRFRVVFAVNKPVSQYLYPCHEVSYVTVQNAKIELLTLVTDEFLLAKDLYNDGYKNGYTQGYDTGFGAGEAVGYTDGLSDGTALEGTSLGALGGVLGSTLNLFTRAFDAVGNLNVFGITIWSLIGIVIAFGLVMLILKMIRG